MERAREDLDRDRTAVRGADKAVDDLERAALSVARVAAPGERAAAALEIRRGDVVEDERPLAQVAAGECVLDPPLTGEQPVERRVELVLVRALDPELGGERRLREGARHLKLRTRCEHALDRHRQTQLALARAAAVEQPRKPEPPAQRKQRLDVAGRQRARDPEALVEADEALALERRAHELDHVLGQVRDIADRLVPDPAALAPGAPQQVSDVLTVLALPPVGDDMDRTSWPRLSAHTSTLPHKPDR
jgi:hypothetical protein